MVTAEIGENSLYGDAISSQISSYVPTEVRLRVAARVKTRAEAERIGDEVEALYTNGPSGGGVTRSLALDMHGKTLGSALLEMEL